MTSLCLPYVTVRGQPRGDSGGCASKLSENKLKNNFQLGHYPVSNTSFYPAWELCFSSLIICHKAIEVITTTHIPTSDNGIGAEFGSYRQVKMDRSLMQAGHTSSAVCRLTRGFQA
ncbi:DASH complex subunit duo1 [Fusarium oxysporum f. sp. albedinis]|nr:DASH complex subunit duo1 [Fusarium oxysporum f. sp. albedinis]